MQYLDALPEELGIQAGDRTVTYDMIDDSRLRRVLGGLGYRFVHVSSGWGPTERNEIADVGYEFQPALTEFEDLLAFTTWLQPVMPFIAYGELKGRVLYNFDTLSAVPLGRTSPTRRRRTLGISANRFRPAP